MSTLMDLGQLAPSLYNASNSFKALNDSINQMNKSLNALETVNTFIKLSTTFTTISSAFAIAGAVIAVLKMFQESTSEKIMGMLTEVLEDLSKLKNDMDTKFVQLSHQITYQAKKTAFDDSITNLQAVAEVLQQYQKKLINGEVDTGPLEEKLKELQASLTDAMQQVRDTCSENEDSLFGAMYNYQYANLTLLLSVGTVAIKYMTLGYYADAMIQMIRYTEDYPNRTMQENINAVAQDTNADQGLLKDVVSALNSWIKKYKDNWEQNFDQILTALILPQAETAQSSWEDDRKEMYRFVNIWRDQLNEHYPLWDWIVNITINYGNGPICDSIKTSHPQLDKPKSYPIYQGCYQLWFIKIDKPAPPCTDGDISVCQDLSYCKVSNRQISLRYYGYTLSGVEIITSSPVNDSQHNWGAEDQSAGGDPVTAWTTNDIPTQIEILPTFNDC